MSLIITEFTKGSAIVFDHIHGLTGQVYVNLVTKSVHMVLTFVVQSS